MNAIFTNSKNVLGMILALALTIGATATNASAFVAPPTITSVSPGSGPLTAGTLITIKGSNLTGASIITIGGVATTNIVVVSGTSVTTIAPANSVAGAKDVALTTVGGTTTLPNAFTYIAAPTITSVSPISGPLTAGTAITITGTNLTGASSVFVGGIAATSIVVTSTNSLTAVTPAGSVGSKDVSVTTIGGIGSKQNSFAYIAPPSITSVTPTSGPLTAGTTITITGTNLTDASRVLIGGIAATNVVVVSSTSITAKTPANTAGAKEVSVTTVVGGPITKTNAFTYIAAPTIRLMSPTFGPLTAGTTVTITGTNLTGATLVTFGGVAATTLNVISSTSMTAVTPSGIAGSQAVSVTTPGGTETVGGAFTYVAAPTITLVDPPSGLLAAGTAISITGTNFTGANSVTVGGIAATSVVIASDTSITAKTPAGSVGAKTIAVTTAGGTATSGFTYIAAPVISSISPVSGPLTAGTAITITGLNFNGASSVKIGGVAATNVIVKSDTSITAVSPAGKAGSQTILVTTVGGTATKTRAFTYVIASAITSVSPTSGPLTGSTTISIKGTGFTGASSVTVAGVAATNVVVVSSILITAVTPAGSVGSKDVSVTTVGGTSTKASAFTYAEIPTISSVGPISGPLKRGTAITITGTSFSGASKVLIDGVVATAVVVTSTTSLTAVTPAGTAGAKSVSVTTPGGTGTKTNAFTYVEAPTIVSASPFSGPLVAGTAITITGTNFIGATKVLVGGTNATNVVVTSANSITAVTPAGKAGAQTISVTTIGGTATKSSAFTYLAAPTITSVSPLSGPLTAGTEISITGKNFAGANSVKVDGVAATNILVVSSTSITAKVPAGSAGAKDVSVTTVGGTATLASAFTYFAAPTITMVDPPSGLLLAGTPITISGTNLTGTSSVLVGGVPATNVVVHSDYSISARTPAGSVGVKNISVTTIGGTVIKTNAFTYVAAPTITSLSPISGPLTAGTAITITGTNLTNASKVKIGGLEANSLVVNSATSLSIVAPAGTVGSTDVSVTTIAGTVIKLSAFTYVAAPTIVSVSPISGPLTAGTPITITGTNFTNTSSVTVGGTAATSVIVVSSNSISAITPVGTAGLKDISVTTVGGKATKTNAFTYFAAPTIVTVSPISGPLAAGTAITITGTNFTSANRVTIGGLEATNVVVLSPTSVTAVTPAGSVGAKDVSLTTPGGIANKSSAFTYFAAPTIASVNPNTGSTAGSTAITITGTNLTGATIVKIAGVAATSVVVVSSTSITALTPAGTVGAKAVSVTTPGGTATKANSFTYINSFTDDGQTASDANHNGDGSVVASGKGSNNSGKNTTTSGANNSTATENLATAPMGMELYLQTIAQRADAQAQCEDMQTENLVASDLFIASTDATLEQVTTNEKTEVAADSNAVATQDTGVLSAIDLDLNGEPDICQLRRGDLDLNSEIDARDMAILINMIDTEPLMGIGDLDGNGVIDAADMSVILLQMQ